MFYVHLHNLCIILYSGPWI